MPSVQQAATNPAPAVFDGLWSLCPKTTKLINATLKLQRKTTATDQVHANKPYNRNINLHFQTGLIDLHTRPHGSG
jgi:hypothetical protein